MDRLTARTASGTAYLVNVKPTEQEIESKYPETLRCILNGFARLAEYEDTGLTPEEVRAAVRLLQHITAKYETSVKMHGITTELLNRASADLARVTAERDAAIADLEFAMRNCGEQSICKLCARVCFIERRVKPKCSGAKWRGVRETPHA